MQFDGVPSTKGREFYEGVIRPVADYVSGFYTEGSDPKPTPEFFKLARRFLDYYQYESPHSINSQTKEKVDDFLSNKDLYNSEWRYLFDRDGNFTILQPGGMKVVIPWKFTIKMIQTVGLDFHSAIKCKHEHGFGDFWELISRDQSEIKENAKVARWTAKQALLHPAKDLEYDTSRNILAQILKGDPVSSVYPIVLSLEYRVIKYENGQETVGALKLNGKVLHERTPNSSGKVIDSGCQKVIVK